MRNRRDDLPARRGEGGRIAGLALGAAALLGATALQLRANTRRAERAHPPRGRFLDLGGMRLHYFDAGRGEGPPVVLLHGNGTTAEDWLASGVFARVASRRRVVAFDRPGYGYSDRPRGRTWTAGEQAALFASAFRRLGLQRPVVVGHSWGALVAVALGLDHRRSVSGLVLVGGYHFPTARPDAVAFSTPAVPVIGDLIRYTTGPLVGRMIAPKLIRKVFEPAPVPPAFTAAVPVPIMLRPWQLRASAEDSGCMVPDVAAMAPHHAELRGLPLAIVAGAEDQIVDVGRHSRRLHQELPGSRLQVVPGLGHMVHHGAPGLVAEAIEEIAAAAEMPPAARVETMVSAGPR